MENRSGNAVTIGNFDGFHLGHKKIVQNSIQIATEYSLGKVLLTFKPNHRIYFKIEDKLIFSESKKNDTLNSLDIGRIEFVDFTKVFDMDGRNFVDKFLLDKFSMRYLIVGENFRLGKGREWDTVKLSEYGEEKNFKVKVVSSELYKNTKISSTLIRSFLRKGDLITAQNMLGDFYSVEGVVEKGNQIGTRMGFPTINIVNDNCILPDGVYMTRVLIDNAFYNAATYIGSKPSLKGDIRKIETHIFDLKEDLYDRFVEVQFIRFKREGISFSNEKELIFQIKKDISSIKFDFKNEVC